MKTQTPKTKLDKLLIAQNRYRELRGSTTATREEIKQAQNDYEIARDVYSLDCGMDN